MSRPISRAEDRPSGFQPLSAPRSLTQQLFTRLTADITSGKLPPGSRLPTEQEMIAATGVSRTVVREAVAHLRAEGLVITRQGVGAFVAENVRRPFRIDFDESSSLREVLDVMELRTGIEIEAAGLAAERATPADLKKIADRLRRDRRGDRARRDGRRSGFRLPLRDRGCDRQSAIPRFLEYLGRFIIPRQTDLGPLGAGAEPAPISTCSRASTAQILQAIQARAVTQARAAMREHLLNSRQRYQKLADELGVK